MRKIEVNWLESRDDLNLLQRGNRVRINTDDDDYVYGAFHRQGTKRGNKNVEFLVPDQDVKTDIISYVFDIDSEHYDIGQEGEISIERAEELEGDIRKRTYSSGDEGYTSREQTLSIGGVI